MKAFSFANASSMGLRSGLYGEEAEAGPGLFNRRLDLGLFVDSEIVEDDGASPGRSVGTSTCST